MTQCELKGLQPSRRAKGYTQVQLAKLLGVSQGALAIAESGEKPLSLAKVINAAKILDVTIDYIITGV